ncbi:MAG: DUF2585 family protein [Acidobacteriota bacterium]|nr:DUF2585 family protein [Acidobacteriota bacterium]
MPARNLSFDRKRFLPVIIIAGIFLATAFELHNQGRLWICACGRVLIWAGNICSSDNSQHLFDPYSFTHLLHGFAFCGLLALIVPRVPFRWRLCLAILLEVLWEIIENSEYVIQRYREATAALGYHGDTVLNSLGDITACALGFLLAQRLGLWRSLILFVAVEAVLTIWIRDSLILQVIMLLHPIDAIKAWQLCP